MVRYFTACRFSVKRLIRINHERCASFLGSSYAPPNMLAPPNPLLSKKTHLNNGALDNTVREQFKNKL